MVADPIFRDPIFRGGRAWARRAAPVAAAGGLAPEFVSIGVSIVPSSNLFPTKPLTLAAPSAQWFCTSTYASGSVVTRLGHAHPPASNLPKFSCLKRKRKGVWGKSPKKLKENFGVAFALQSYKSSSQSPFKK
jgi:hypothetical protein